MENSNLNFKYISVSLFRFIIIYILFAFSIFISIAYNEYTVFNKFVFNNYVLEKIFGNALTNTAYMFVASRIFWYCFAYLNISKEPDVHSKEYEKSILQTDIFARILVVVLFSITLLPIRAIVRASYIGDDGTFLRLDFVHLDTNTKIIVSLLLIVTFLFFVYKKYKPNIKNMIVIFCLLLLPPGYNIISTQNQNFDKIGSEISAIENSDISGASDLINHDIGTRMKPLAEKLLSIAKNDEERAIAYVRLSSAEKNLGNTDLALEYIKKSLRLNEYSASTYIGEAQILRSIDDFDNSLIASNRCLQIATEKSLNQMQAKCESEIAFAYKYMGQRRNAYKNLKNFLDAETHMRNASNFDPEQIYYKKGIIDILTDEATYYENTAHDYPKALEILNKIISTGDKSREGMDLSRAYLVRGSVKSDMKDHEGALSDFNESMAIYSFKATQASIGREYLIMGDNSNAIINYDKAIAMDPKNEAMIKNQELINTEISLYYVMGDNQKVIDAYDRLISLEPNNPNYHSGKANTFNEMKDYKNALISFNRAYELNTNPIWKEDSLQSIAVTYYYLNNIPQMCSTLVRASSEFNRGTYSIEVKDSKGEYSDIVKLCNK